MTNREKKLWDILNKYGFSEWRKTRKCLFSDLTALISEHYYPNDFILWVGEKCRFCPDGKTWTYFESVTKYRFFSDTKELFDFWRKTNGQ